MTIRDVTVSACSLGMQLRRAKWNGAGVCSSVEKRGRNRKGQQKKASYTKPCRHHAKGKWMCVTEGGGFSEGY